MNDYSERTEKELLDLLKQADQNALSALYYQNIQKLKYFIQRTAQSPQLTEDIVHDTFIKIWESRNEIDSNRPFKPYLFTIARRLLLNMLKRAQHETTIISEIRKYAPVAEFTTEMSVEYNESNSTVMEALNTLTGQPKEVFLRCRIQGLTYKQTAEELGITESTVNKHMNKALTHVRAYIKNKNALGILLACIALCK